MGTRFAKYWDGYGRICRAIGIARNVAKADILHSYQRILLNRRVSWVVSFDALMPFFPKPYPAQWIYDAIFSVLARNNCKAILPHSFNALEQLKIRNRHHAKLQAVLDKAEVVYPSVADYPDLYLRALKKGKRERVRLLFVGRQFFIKGGHLLLEAFRALGGKGLSLTIVSELVPDDWTTERSIRMVEDVRRSIADLRVTYYARLSNLAVREVMAESDVLVLPSIDETFGFVILEAMATGLPVIATGVRAIPELVEDGVTGWLIRCTTDAEGRLVRDGKHEFFLLEKLKEVLAEVLEKREILRSMGEAGRRRYSRLFSTGALSANLNRIYLSSAPGA